MTTFSGSAAEFRSSLKSEPFLILAAIVVIYIVLGVLYESYIHPITILSTLPSAGVGALLALMICHIDFSMIALIGIILLIGIVQKNAIMMIDFALDAEREEGLAAGQVDLQGLPPAVPADHDDDVRRAARRVAAGAGNRHRLRAAPPDGHRDRRRPDPVANAHALHHAGHLHLPRPAGQVGPATSRCERWVATERTEPRDVMNVSEPFIRRPAGTSLLAAGLFLLGIVAYRFLPVAAIPRVDFPMISVSASLPGADPATVASSLAAPLERRIAQISGVTEITSVSTLGGTTDDHPVRSRPQY